jgi:hypothetical protein
MIGPQKGREAIESLNFPVMKRRVVKITLKDVPSSLDQIVDWFVDHCLTPFGEEVLTALFTDQIPHSSPLLAKDLWLFGASRQ